MEKIEKKLDRLEKKVERKFSHIEESFKLFRDIVIKLQSEKEGLERNIELMEKRKEEIRKISISDSEFNNFIEPIKTEFKENVELIRKMAGEGMEREK